MKQALLILTCTALSLELRLRARRRRRRHGQGFPPCARPVTARLPKATRRSVRPRLAGQHGWYLARELGNFKQGLRGADSADTFGTQMRPMAQTLTDDAAVANVVAYIGTLQSPAPAATVQGDAAAGKAAYATLCGVPRCERRGQSVVERAEARRPARLVHRARVAELQNGPARRRRQGHLWCADASDGRDLADDAAVNNVAAYIATLK